MSNNELYSRIGLVLKNKRKIKNMTQKELSEESGISQISIGYYERGQRRPKLEQILKLARALDMNPRDLTDDYEYEKLSNYKENSLSNPFFDYLQYIGYLVELDEENRLVKLIDVITDSFSEGILTAFSFDAIDSIDKTISDFTKKLIFAISEGNINGK